MDCYRRVMNERMKKLRDEMAIQWSHGWNPTIEDHLTGAMGMNFCAGFDAAHDLLMKDVSGLIEALKKYSLEQTHEFTARAALAAWNKKYGNNLTTKENENGTRDT